MRLTWGPRLGRRKVNSTSSVPPSLRSTDRAGYAGARCSASDGVRHCSAGEGASAGAWASAIEAGIASPAAATAFRRTSAPQHLAHDRDHVLRRDLEMLEQNAARCAFTVT